MAEKAFPATMLFLLEIENLIQASELSKRIFHSSALFSVLAFSLIVARLKKFTNFSPSIFYET